MLRQLAEYHVSLARPNWVGGKLCSPARNSNRRTNAGRRHWRVDNPPPQPPVFIWLTASVVGPSLAEWRRFSVARECVALSARPAERPCACVTTQCHSRPAARRLPAHGMWREEHLSSRLSSRSSLDLLFLQRHWQAGPPPPPPPPQWANKGSLL